jgi:hypothetical protein
LDVVVLTLTTGGLVMTAGGLTVATVDVAGQVRDYRAAVQVAPRVRIEDPRLRALSGRVASNVAHQLEAEVKARELAEKRLAAAAGATTNLRRLWVSAAVAVAGVALSGAADIVAAIHAK